MRFMMLMFPGKAHEVPGAMPTAEQVAAMMKYNEELAKAGVLLSLDGLHDRTKAVRISWPAGGKVKVTDGPFAESKEVVGGYWIIQTKSKEEAIEWARRIPAHDPDAFVEVRQIFEMSDFPADVQAAADSSVVKAAIEKHQ